MPHSARLIEQHKRLVLPRVAETYAIGEYLHTGLGNAWVLDLPAYDSQADTYRRAFEARLPVFSGYGLAESLLLIVPKGTRSLARAQRFIARDVDNYREIFRQVGEVVGRVATADLGTIRPTIEGSILSKFAFSPQKDASYGGQVYLLPPFGFDSGEQPSHSLQYIGDELNRSGYFNSRQIGSLIGAVVDGMDT